MAAPMTKSIVTLARTARRAAERALPRYSARTSRHDYTQAQLVALLVVRSALDLDYRGVVVLVTEWAELRRAVGLTPGKVPHYSTLCYAERRLEKGGPWPPSRPPSSTAPRAAASSRAPRPRGASRSPSTARGIS